MENVSNAVNTETVAVEAASASADAVSLMAQLSFIPRDAGQLALETIVKGRSVAEVIAVDNMGVYLSGGAERALAALVNLKMQQAHADHMEKTGKLAGFFTDDAGVTHWSQIEHRCKSIAAKALKPIKDEAFTAWSGHSNPSTKWSRVRAHAYELANPKVTGEVVAEGAEGAEGASTTSRTRDLYARAVIETGKLYRALTATENDDIIKKHSKSAQLVAALEHITATLKALDAPLEDDDLKQLMASLAK
jgi:hypothetical protein